MIHPLLDVPDLYVGGSSFFRMATMVFVPASLPIFIVASSNLSRNRALGTLNLLVFTVALLDSSRLGFQWPDLTGRSTLGIRIEARAI